MFPLSRFYLLERIGFASQLAIWDGKTPDQGPVLRVTVLRVAALEVMILLPRFPLSVALQANDDPPYLELGTEVSAKYRGAFCEAKVKILKRCVRVKV